MCRESGDCFPITYGRWRAERNVSYRLEQRLTGDVTALTN